MDCLFCKIAQGEIKGGVVYEDEKVMALLDIQPRALGHTFVIPKEHYTTLLDLPDNLVESLFLAVKKVAEKVKETVLADGLTIGINQGRASGQEVDHLHIHIIPRFKGDRGGSMQSVVSNTPSEKERKIIREKLIL
ncbi:MAG: hypothetical protein COV57_00090 [Candidatus Liptonbacteria bacterium CG11_big_fil_rev_8_21_14_0_20_35_14]|uniref:HIT domain-containing protein n=1 Tax=Candidatus Liptonbacteria bacterium CG11_big_fil_rev_8_21_14_0_20_35_14 TaxID=1974634 RepID=A0A2H0N8L5_9BACT|nr:MAG: hypothetical protein COV57_00090 [Candidatus Liptonbacteria bacterium CG11_big_fil_rev_8_21_14_0_20_35_14]